MLDRTFKTVDCTNLSDRNCPTWRSLSDTVIVKCLLNWTEFITAVLQLCTIREVNLDYFLHLAFFDLGICNVLKLFERSTQPAQVDLEDVFMDLFIFYSNRLRLSSGYLVLTNTIQPVACFDLYVLTSLGSILLFGIGLKVIAKFYFESGRMRWLNSAWKKAETTPILICIRFLNVWKLLVNYIHYFKYFHLTILR